MTHKVLHFLMNYSYRWVMLKNVLHVLNEGWENMYILSVKV